MVPEIGVLGGGVEGGGVRGEEDGGVDHVAEFAGEGEECGGVGGWRGVVCVGRIWGFFWGGAGAGAGGGL